MATTVVDTGRGGAGQHRESFAQAGADLIAYCNGHDANRIYSLKGNSAYDLGLAPPAAAPTRLGVGAGSFTGTFKYRVRWKDSKTGTLSLPGPSLEVTLAAEAMVVVKPTGSPPARVTHWVIERTSASGTVYFPVNVTPANPHGTLIAGSNFTDNMADDDFFSNQKKIPAVQGVPGAFQWCAGNLGRLFMGGGRVHRVAVTVTSGSATVTSAAGYFTAAMVGQTFCIPADLTGTAYEITGYVSANQITLAGNYVGTTGTKTCAIAGARNLGAWSEHSAVYGPGACEYFGAQTYGALTNEVYVGDGEPLTGGVGLGLAGFLWAKETQLFLHAYTQNPGPDGGGQLLALPTRRGALSVRALAYIAGVVYGMDQFGIWRYEPGGLPQEIGGPLRYDWHRGALNWAQAANWWLQWRPENRKLVFWVCDKTDLYPRLGYVWDLNRNRWVDTVRVPLGRTIGEIIPDLEGHLRGVGFSEASGGVSAYCWADGIGNSLGAPTETALLNGTATGGGVNFLDKTGAAWPTTGWTLAGCHVLLVRALDGTEETRVISANTGTRLQVSANWTGAAPVAGDTFRIAPLEWRYRTPRLNCGFPDRKKTFRHMVLCVKTKASCSRFYVRAYYDGASIAEAPDTDKLAMSEDGVTQVAARSAVTVDATAAKTRYKIPLNNQPATDLQLELCGSEAGAPPEILGPMRIVYDVDEAEDPRL